MNPERPLREVFDQLAAGSAAEPLAGWPEPLLSEAIVSYADTAPVEVAEHLAPFVTAHSTGETMPVGQGLELLGSVPPSGPETPVDTDYGAGDRDQPALEDTPEPASEETDVAEPVSFDLDWQVSDLPEPGGLPPALELPTEEPVEDGFDDA